MLFGLSWPAALAVCMALSLSSTAVVLRIIADRRELRRRSGRLSFSVLVVQDIVVLGMLALLPVVATWAGFANGAAETAAVAADPPRSGWQFAGDAVLMMGGVAVLVIVAKSFLPTVLQESLRGKRLEVMMLVGLAAALGAAVAARAIGFSLEMGAFLAGFVLAGTPFRHQLSGQIGPLRDILSALFFTTVGMKLDPAVVLEHWWIILACVAATAVVKAVVIGGVCWSVGAMASTAIVVGLYLAQAGEFSLILIGESADLGIVSEGAASTTIAVIVVSLIATPGLAGLGRHLARVSARIGHAPWIKSSLIGEAPDAEQEERKLKHIIVAGFGPVGRRIIEELEEAGVSYTLVELNPDTVREQQRQRKPIVFGDVANVRVLESAGINHADALILTIPDEDAVMRACAVARRRAPDLFIAARTGLLSKSSAATKIGADHVTVDEMATAEAMVRVVMDRVAAGKEELPEEIEPDAELASAEAEKRAMEGDGAEEREEAEMEVTESRSHEVTK
jgi:CPA2 family monovalent cation:H+ antiporter-2